MATKAKKATTSVLASLKDKKALNQIADDVETLTSTRRKEPTHSYFMRIPESVWALYDKEAKEQDRTIQQLILRAMKAYNFK